MPVYNGQNFVGQAIESILSQTFRDFELVINDNTSSDATSDICREYAAHDPRISYHRHASNIGPAPNFNDVFLRTGGEYFKWAAHDDIIEPSYLEEAVAVLDREADAVLCTSRVRVIDEDGNVCDDYDGTEAYFDVNDVVKRFENVIAFHRTRQYEIFSVIRRSALVKTNLIGSYKTGDGVLLADLSLRGRFVQIPERLFLPRRHATQSQMHIKNARSYSEWFDPANRQRLIMMPYWRVLGELRKVVGLSDLSSDLKAKCRKKIVRQGLNTWRQLRGDIRRVPAQLIRKSLSSFAPLPQRDDKNSEKQN